LLFNASSTIGSFFAVVGQEPANPVSHTVHADFKDKSPPCNDVTIQSTSPSLFLVTYPTQFPQELSSWTTRAPVTYSIDSTLVVLFIVTSVSAEITTRFLIASRLKFSWLQIAFYQIGSDFAVTPHSLHNCLFSAQDTRPSSIITPDFPAQA
jgi:hypothetical protein